MPSHGKALKLFGSDFFFVDTGGGEEEHLLPQIWEGKGRCAPSLTMANMELI